MICKECPVSEIKRSVSGTIDRYCGEETVNGFQNCNKDRQCTMCKFESGNDEKCEICLALAGKPYFESKRVG